MGTEGLLSPQMLWLLLWIQLCRGKCHLPCPTAQGQQVPAWSLGSVREWGFFAGATEGQKVLKSLDPVPTWMGESIISFSRLPPSRAACAWLDT